MLELEEMVTREAPSQSYPCDDEAMWFRRCFLVFVVAYAGLLTWFCSLKAMAFDELLSYYTERAPSVARLIELQRTTPVSLDPPLVHLAGYWAMHLGINPVFAVRLPSLLGAVLMLACAYLFTRRLVGEAAAYFAVVGLMIADSFHMVEARPYGVLLGLSALALVLWQNILRERHRRASLVGLFFTLGAAISSHYFGILLVVPFLVAECARTLHRRKLDFGLAAVLATSPVFAVGWLPFLAGAHQYKSNYYIKVQWIDLTRAYTSSFETILHVHNNSGELLLFAVVLAPITFGAWLGYRRCDAPTSIPEWTGIFTFALLPLAGVLLAVVASGAFEVRYVVEFTLGTIICLAAGLMAIVEGRTLRRVLLVAACIVALALLGRSAVHDAADRHEFEQLAGATLVEQTLMTDKEEFLWLHAYHAGDAGSANAIWVADLGREIAATHTDNIDRTMMNLRTMASLPVISYAEATAGSQSWQLIVNDGSDPTNWLPAALADSGLQLMPVKTLGSRHIYQVPPAATK